MTLVPDKTLHLTQRINGAMQDVAYIQREDKVVPGAGFRPISAQAVKAKVRPILIKWGITIVPSECLKSETIQWTSDKGRPMFFTTIVQGYRVANADNASDSFTCSICACGADQTDKGANKALTMTEKQLFINLFHIEVGDDAESSLDYEAPTNEEVATISDSQLVELKQYADTLKLSPKIIATAAGVNEMNEISLAKFPEIKERLLKRIAQTTPVHSGVTA